MRSVTGGVKFFQRAPYPAAILHDGHLVPRDSLSWNIDNMLHVMKVSAAPLDLPAACRLHILQLDR